MTDPSFGVPGGDINDVTNSAAYTALNDLLKKGHLTQAQVDLYKSKYAKLHEVVLQTYENEKNLLKNAKALNQEVCNLRCTATCNLRHAACPHSRAIYLQRAHVS